MSLEECSDIDPRKDSVKYKEILMASCPLESHLEYHDVCVMDKSFSEFRALLIKEMRSDPLSSPRELYDRIRIEFCKNMTPDEEDEFSESLGQVSRQTLLRKLREVKEETIGKMPKTQSKFIRSKRIKSSVYVKNVKRARIFGGRPFTPVCLPMSSTIS